MVEPNTYVRGFHSKYTISLPWLMYADFESILKRQDNGKYAVAISYAETD